MCLPDSIALQGFSSKRLLQRCALYFARSEVFNYEKLLIIGDIRLFITRPTIVEVGGPLVIVASSTPSIAALLVMAEVTALQHHSTGSAVTVSFE